ncbi:hypothetical protein LOD99_5021 [Oopsacas minuta]|uniref:Polyglutamine-binding protein 1 n=1 Tax=Oopsacas minuta TaxID=111878 RepID=A0AAV7JTI1_9METZ|nr:hypothetical protein LOD99_5021 [Oopsacas minuta]
MSLTPAMKARLAKRGLLSSQDTGKTDTKLISDKGVDFDRSTLPANWEEVIDENTGYPYYWNTDTDLVQWEPPTPDEITAPDQIQDQHPESNHKDKSQHRNHPDRFSKSKHKDRHRPYDRADRKKHREDDDEIDPMDPSSYSDIPRGSWSTGLPTKGQGRGGAADETASGPLFQMRPYPNPGAVLKLHPNPSERVGPNLPLKFQN